MPCLGLFQSLLSVISRGFCTDNTRSYASWLLGRIFFTDYWLSAWETPDTASVPHFLPWLAVVGIQDLDFQLVPQNVTAVIQDLQAETGHLLRDPMLSLEDSVD